MITLQDLIDRFGENELANLTDKENYTVIDETVINHAISDATAEVVGYLNPTGLIVGGAYLGTPPKSLILKTCDIARYYLYENGVTDIVEKRYQQAIDWLLLVQKNPSMLTGLSETGANNGVKSGIAVKPNPVPSLWSE
ncbi:Mu-like prophage protein gp36 [Moraxella lacunata]|uniref:Mu-like prophage protein gp36 n=1 Tax=Moraxella lacunata TaxID=477 RepID=A0A378TSW0_MORLA|nr:DUF1320 domain-containing protein [Moraxella lacunata]STZ63919.1 Mu-like prophage protein gp36 [Moraxella lacunata]